MERLFAPGIGANAVEEKTFFSSVLVLQNEKKSAKRMMTIMYIEWCSPKSKITH